MNILAGPKTVCPLWCYQLCLVSFISDLPPKFGENLQPQYSIALCQSTFSENIVLVTLRTNWGQRHIRWRIRKCWSVFLTDESRFDLGRSDELWLDEMKRRLRLCHDPPDMLGRIRGSYPRGVVNILWAFLWNLIASMRRRYVASVNGRGGYTRCWYCEQSFWIAWFMTPSSAQTSATRYQPFLC